MNDKKRVIKQKTQFSKTASVQEEKAKKLLAESNFRFESLFMNMAQGVMYQDSTGVITMVNPAAQNILGLTIEQMQGHTLLDLNWHAIHEDGSDFPNEQYPAFTVLRTGQPIHNIVMGVYHPQDQQYRWVLVNAVPEFHKGNHTPYQVHTTFTDITERKQAEKTRRDTEQRYRSLFENLPIAIWEEDFSSVKDYLKEIQNNGITDLDTYLSTNEKEVMKCIGLIKIIDVNQAGVEMYEAKSKSELSDGFLQTFSETSQRSFKNELLAVARDERNFQSETIIHTIKGAQLLVHVAWTVAPGHENDYSRVLVSIADITKRKKAEEELRDSEEKYRGLMKSLDSVIATVNADGQFLYMNDIAAKQLGGEPEQLIGKTMYELFPEAIAAMQMKNILKVIHEDTNITHEYPSVINGKPRWYRTTIQPIHDRDGRVIHALINSTDIHELKTAQYELMELAETLEEKVKKRTAEVQDLYDNAPAGYHSLDNQGRIVLINQTELNWLGYTRDEMIGHFFKEFITPESLVTFQKNYPLFKERGLVRDLEFELIRKDGSTLHTLVNADAINDEQGNYLMSRSTVFDNTKRKDAEEALRESQANLQDFLDTASDIIQSLDEEGRYIYVNNAWCDALGYDHEEVKKLSMFDVLDPTHHDHCRDTLHNLLVDGRSQQLEVIFRTKSGHPIVVEGSMSGRINKDGQALTNGIFRNITHRKEVENALRIANNEMERALRMKDEFLTSMSHELRTPLTGILGLSEALQYNTYGELNQRQMNAVINIENSGRHLLDLINDILDISKMEAGKLELEMQTCSLNEICQDALQLTKGMAQKKKQIISFSTTSSNIDVLGDSRRLKQIVVNLLSNAIKYSPENSPIGLEIMADEQSQTTSVTVWDKGIGIAEEDLKKLFKPFVQLDSSLSRQQTGTGLGLALVERLVDLHGGSIHVESIPGEGSRFTINLSTQKPNADLQRDDTVIPPYIKRAMIVEDNSLDSGRLTRQLKMFGVESTVLPIGAGSVEKAIEIAPDVIMLDLKLPDMNGWDVLKQIKAEERTRNIPVIVTSVLDDFEEAHKLGASGYLVKLYTLSDLRTELARLHTPFEQPQQAASEPALQPGLATIMIVDDNETNTFMLKDFLAAQSFNVFTATSGLEFMSRVTDIQPDLVLMDIQMPDMNGLETTQRLRSMPDKQLASTPVIAITALAMPGDRERCIEAGANEYLSKPIRLRELASLIASILKTD